MSSRPEEEEPIEEIEEGEIVSEEEDDEIELEVVDWTSFAGDCSH